MSIAGTKNGSGVWQRIISEMPEHDVYIEPFWGRGSIYCRKRRAKASIGCDLDPEAIEHGRRHGAMMFHCDGLQFVADYFGTRSTAPGSCDTGSSGSVPRGNAATFGGVGLDRHFIYLDPPYLGCGLRYYTWFRRWIQRQSIDEKEWHRVLCRTFLRLPCPAALSGYDSDLYAEELGDARAIRIPTTNRAGKPVTEVLWMNFDPPARYHDTRFVGVGRRERERIRRRVKTWSEGLNRMPPAERQAVWEELESAYRDS